MRLRIQTFSPLPELKAWFIPEIQDTHKTVFDLKELLCNGIPQLRGNQIHSQRLVLLLDGFELLNDSPISAVRDGDLIVVKMVQRTKEHVDMGSGLPSQSRKRKRNLIEFDRSPYKIPFLMGAAAALQPFPHQNVSESDSESNTSDSSSDSPSDSSSSTSSSDSSPITHPVDNALIPPRLGFSREPLKQPPKTTHVPPGQGKPSTHSRNKRRRKKREHEKHTKAVVYAQPKGISEANIPLRPTRTENIIDSSSVALSASIPQSSSSNGVTLGSLSAHDVTPIPNENDRSSSSKYVHITEDQVMMGSLRNKNKKKGFKQAMKGPIPRKITFSGGVSKEQPNESDPVLDDHAPQNPGGQQSSEANRTFHRLIPPSELQDLGKLPPNVFVTSVDVEKHIWGSHDGLPKKKKGNKRKNMYVDNGYGFEGDQEQAGDDEGYGEDLTYGDGAQAGEQTSVASNGVDWDKAEEVWEASSPIKDIQQLIDGVVFGWKELAINPQTFSPEMLLFLARITSVNHEGIDGEGNITDGVIRFRKLQRPGTSEAAVAFGVAVSGSEGPEADNDMSEEERAAWSDVLEGQWRLVNL